MSDSYTFALSGARTGEPVQRHRRAYYEHRARAMVDAGSGVADAALPELAASWELGRPAVVDQAVDVAWVHLIAGDIPRALAALALGIRGRARMPPKARELVAECVALQPSLGGTAVRACLRGGTIADRIRAISCVLRALSRLRS